MNNMLMTSVLAVALGYSTVSGPEAQTVTVSPAAIAKIGHFSQSIGRDGNTHLRGFDCRTGQPFDLAVATDGHVEGIVGIWDISFQVRDPA
jgi:hypothetical protein